jgi:glycosyltransferase involved in cell wall biosynthesis
VPPSPNVTSLSFDNGEDRWEERLTGSVDAMATGCSQRRLLMLSPRPEVAGPIPKLAEPLARALESYGWEIQTAPWGRRCENEGAADKVFGRARDILRIRSQIGWGDHRVLFVHTATDWQSLLRDVPLLLVAQRSVRRVLLFHGSGPAWLADRGHQVFKLATYARLSLSDAVLVLSSQDVEQWKRFYPKGHVHLVANAFVGMDHSQPMRPVERDAGAPPSLLFVGRLMAEKGVLDLLDAFVKVRSQVDCRLTMVGEGPLAGELRRRAFQLGVADSVVFTGYLAEPELTEVYLRTDVFVLPTYHLEGFPTVLAEAMSFGLPIVTTSVGGAPDYLTEGENVLYVPPRQPEALATALDRLLRDKTLREELGENNRRKVGDFAPMRVVGDYARVLDDVVGPTACTSSPFQNRLERFKALLSPRWMR